MKALVQRVSEASVTVEGERVGEIGPGLLVLLGVEAGDGAAEADLLARKIAGLRIFEDAAGKMNLALREVGGAVLAISQFTLAADLRKGNRPSFIRAAPPERRGAPLRAVLHPPAGGGPAGRDRPLRRAHGGPPDQRRPGHHLARQRGLLRR